MFPRAIAKRKICKIGRACGLGCVPKSHNCKAALRGQAKTAAEWLAHVTANPNYEAENNAKIDKRIERFNSNVKSHYNRLTNRDSSKFVRESLANPNKAMIPLLPLANYDIRTTGEKPITYNQLTDRLGKEQADKYLQKIAKLVSRHWWAADAEEKVRNHPLNNMDDDQVKKIEDQEKKQRIEDQEKKQREERRLYWENKAKEVDDRKKQEEFARKQEQDRINARLLSTIENGKNFIPQSMREEMESLARSYKQYEDELEKAREKKHQENRIKMSEIDSSNLSKTKKQEISMRIYEESNREIHDTFRHKRLNATDTLQKLTEQMEVVSRLLLSKSKITKQKAIQMADGVSFDKTLKKRNKKISEVHNPSLIRQNISDFFYLTGGKGSKSFRLLENTHPRAHASRIGSINIGHPDLPINIRTTMFHEMGHHIEYESKEIQDIAQQFVLSRATSSTLEPIGRWGLQDEVAYPDHFIDKYVGKYYESGSTEVVSMGIQYFSTTKEMATLFRNDAEHFYLILGILRETYV